MNIQLLIGGGLFMYETQEGKSIKQEKGYVEVLIPNEFFCDDCKIIDRVTEKAVEQFIFP